MRILFVAMQESVHTARWVNQIADQGWDIRLFPVSAAPVSSEIRNVTAYGLPLVSPKNLHKSTRYIGLLPIGRNGSNMEKLIFRAYPRLWEMMLVNFIRYLKPDIVHSLEFQHAGYMTLAARKKLGGKFPVWVVTNWGSDIHLFGRLAGHRDMVRSVLENCDYYFCECERDIRLAKDLGLHGKTLPLFPNTGGFDINTAKTLRDVQLTSQRKTILLKGYQQWSGRALFGLRALARCSEVLKTGGYQVAIYSAGSDVVLAAEIFEQDTGIPVKIIPPCTHHEMLKWYAQSRIYIGLSITDAISTSLLEAMVMGTFPIQSCTACVDEWIVEGESGLVVPPEDVDEIEVAIRRALADDKLVDQAAGINWSTALNRLDDAIIKPKVVAIYENIYQTIQEKRS